MRIGIVTVTYRGGDRPLAWAAALQRAADEAGVAVTLQAVAVDSASGDGTADRLRDAAPWVDVVELAQNTGFAAGCNTGLRRLEDPDVVVFANPDIRVAPRFLSTLAALDWPAHLAARGPLVHGLGDTVEQSARGFPRATTGLLGRTSLLARVRPRGRMTRRELRADPALGTTVVDWVSGACLITTPAVLQRVGGLDEGYFMYWEDADWCRRAADRGLTVQYEPSLEVSHDQGSSSSSRRAATVIAFHRSALRYWRLHVAGSPISTALAATALAARCTVKLLVLAVRSLHATVAATRTKAKVVDVATSVIPLGGKPPDYYDHARADLVARLPRPLGRVLDVGCGAGGVGGELRRNGASHMTGIELDPEAAATARQVFDDVREGDALHAARDLTSASFDTIVCYDILEHLYDPAAVLCELRRAVAPAGHLHVSVPNARHASLLRDLYLRGTFGYTPWGHRDSTHIRWFTRSDLERLLGECGWEVTEVDTHPFKPYRQVLTRMTGGALRELFAVQWFVLCRG